MEESPVKKSLDVKLERILADPSCNDFIIADAKDADMAFGVAAAGRSPEHHAQEGRFRSLDEYRELIRRNVEQGLIDIMLMSASTSEVLTIQERLFEDSPITPAVRMNDTSDIWLAAGGNYREHPSLPFRSTLVDHATGGKIDATGDQVATSITYEVNKATSGDDTGLLINKTDTASPGTSLTLDLQTNSVSQFAVRDDGQVGAQGYSLGAVSGALTQGLARSGTTTLVRHPVGGAMQLGDASGSPTITMSSDKDVTFGGEQVKAGTYSLFTIPGADQWTVILNKNLNQWGAYTYDEGADVARVSASASMAGESLEAFSIAFKEVEDGVHLVMGWDKTRVAVPISM